MHSRLAKYQHAIRTTDCITRMGKVRQYVGSVVTAAGPDASLGELCEIYAPSQARPVTAEVVGFREDQVLLMPYSDLRGIKPGSDILATGRIAHIPVGECLLGRIIDAFGRPLDGKPLDGFSAHRPLYAEPINPMQRRRVNKVFETQVKAIDALLTVGEGQRIGLFAGSGVGKSALLGMLAKNSCADVNVIALIGERGRELRDFVETHIGNSLKKTVVIIATAEQSALVRSHAAFAATAIAEYFRDRNHSVALMLDSLTRFAMAQREIGLAVGEPATARGYTPSAFAALPKLLERAGTGSVGQGAITAFYTVLVEGDDLNEPISDHARAVLDGHFVLSREIANRGRYPALDLPKSISRLMSQLATPQELRYAHESVELMAIHQTAQELVDLGAYKAGSNKRNDRALELVPKLEDFIRQSPHDSMSRQKSLQSLSSILKVA